MRSLFYKQTRSFAFNYPCPRNLREIMKMSMIEREPSHKIREIWKQYHQERHQNVAEVLNKDEFEVLKQNAIEAPMFLIPIKRKGGHFMLLGQNQIKTFMYTFLEDFKTHGIKAQPYFVMTLFDELLFRKGITLVRGDIIDFKITKEEAQFVFDSTRRLLSDPDLYHKFVYTFNKQPQQFDFSAFAHHFEISQS